MAENDIYNSKSKYERFRDNLDKLLISFSKSNPAYDGKNFVIAETDIDLR